MVIANWFLLVVYGVSEAAEAQGPKLGHCRCFRCSAGRRRRLGRLGWRAQAAGDTGQGAIIFGKVVYKSRFRLVTSWSMVRGDVRGDRV